MEAVLLECSTLVPRLAALGVVVVVPLVLMLTSTHSKIATGISLYAIRILLQVSVESVAVVLIGMGVEILVVGGEGSASCRSQG